MTTQEISVSTTEDMGKSWLWPDRKISELESRELREEHNRLVNSHSRLLGACWFMLGVLESEPACAIYKAHMIDARAAIAQARGEG